MNSEKYKEKYLEELSSVFEDRKKHYHKEIEKYRKQQIQQGKGGRADMLNTFAERDWKLEEEILRKLKEHAIECRRPLPRFSMVGQPFSQDLLLFAGSKIIPQIGLKILFEHSAVTRRRRQKRKDAEEKKKIKEQIKTSQADL